MSARITRTSLLDSRRQWKRDGQRLLDHFLRSVSNPTVLTEYAKLAGPAIQAGGGRFLTRGTAVLAFEAGVKERSVVIECDSLAKAIEVDQSPA